MSKDIPFVKMTGLGNDYIYIDGIHNDIPKNEIIKLIPQLSRRRFGIGSDGLIFILPSEKADARMEMYNADGSRGEMCGNGLRCVVAFCLYAFKDKKIVEIETDAGLTQGWMEENSEITVKLFGEPTIVKERETVALANQTFVFDRVDVGNPHAVIAYNPIDEIPLDVIGPQIENNQELFPNRVNTEFYEEVTPGHVRMRVWERGSGETWACGTGAAAVAQVYRKKTGHDFVKVSLKGGDLTFDFRDNTLYMTGNATYVASGTFDLQGWNT